MKALNQNKLLPVLPLIAQAMGEKMGVKVKFGRYRTAFTDGDTIYLPHLPADDANAVAILANGFIDHEAAHVRESDFSVIKQCKSALEKHMLNVIEDLRIELAITEAFPGTRKNLAKLVGHLVDVGFFSANTEEQPHPGSVLASAALHCGRADVLGQTPMNDLADASEKRLRDVVGDGAAVRLRSMLAQAKSLSSTQEALDLARKILRMLEEEQEKEKQKEEQEKSQSGDSGDQSGDSGEQSGDSGDQNGDSGEQSGDSDDQPGDSGEQSGDSGDQPGDSGEQSGDSGDQNGDSGEQSGSGASKSDAIERALQASDEDIDVKSDLGEAISEQLGRAMEESKDVQVVSEPAKEFDLNMLSTGAAVSERDVRAVAMRMRAQLQAKLETLLRERAYTSRSGRRFESRALTRPATGDTRIFRKNDEKEGLDTSVSILLDRSGSMRGTPIEVATQATLALMQALDNTKGIAANAAVFPDVGCLTRFSESVPQTRHRYVPFAGGGTPLSPALLWLLKSELSQRQERRKMVIVITDGAPDNPPEARAIIRQMEKAGIEVIGVGIFSDFVESLFSQSVVINDLSELPKELFSVLQRKFD